MPESMVFTTALLVSLVGILAVAGALIFLVVTVLVLHRIFPADSSPKTISETSTKTAEERDSEGEEKLPEMLLFAAVALEHHRRKSRLGSGLLKGSTRLD